jgi:hypothetical protein
MAWSLANDLLGVASVWRPDDVVVAELGAPLPAIVQAVETVSPDVELIRLCDRLVANRAELSRLCDADHWAPDHGPHKPRHDALQEEGDRIEAELYDLADPVTLAGAHAVARAAVSVAPKDADGSITCEYLSEWLNITVVEYMAREGVV